MFTIRKILSIAVLLVLAACAAQNNKPDLSKVEKSVPTPLSAKPGTLAASILADHWKGNAEGHFLVPIDPDSGQTLEDYKPISLGQSYSYAFSPDGNVLAVVGFVTSDHPNGGSLHLIDLHTWEDRVQELRLDSYVNSMGFSPGGERLAIAYGNAESRIVILNVAEPFVKSKSAVLEASMDFIVNKMKFTTDGSGLMVYGYRTENPSTVNQTNPESPFVILLDSADLSIRWNADLVGIRHGIVPKDELSAEPGDLHQQGPGPVINLIPGLTFSPERNVLYVVHADEDKLTVVDFDAQEVGAVEIKPQLSLMDRLLSLTAGVAHAKVAEGTTKFAVISPDGAFLYIVGQQNEWIQDKNDVWQVSENPLGLQVVRTEDGSRLAHYDTDASDLSISPNGRYLLLHGWNQTQNSAWTQIFEISAKQLINKIEHNTWLVPTRRLNGNPILASNLYINGESQHHYATVDPVDLSTLAEWSSSDYLIWLTSR